MWPSLSGFHAVLMIRGSSGTHCGGVAEQNAVVPFHYRNRLVVGVLFGAEGLQSARHGVVFHEHVEKRDADLLEPQDALVVIPPHRLPYHTHRSSYSRDWEGIRAGVRLEIGQSEQQESRQRRTDRPAISESVGKFELVPEFRGGEDVEGDDRAERVAQNVDLARKVGVLLHEGAISAPSQG